MALIDDAIDDLGTQWSQTDNKHNELDDLIDELATISDEISGIVNELNELQFDHHSWDSILGKFSQLETRSGNVSSKIAEVVQKKNEARHFRMETQNKYEDVISANNGEDEDDK